MTSVKLSPFLAALTWIALGATMLFVAGVAIGIPSYSDVLFGFLPDFAFPRGPLIALELAFGLCIEVILFVVGVLVGYAVTDRIFRPSVLRWVDVLVGAAAGDPQALAAAASRAIVNALAILAQARGHPL